MWLQKSSLRATTISAAADGVGARRSATKSAMVTSVSCPTADIVGTGHPAIARATTSSLNAQRSSIEPPPRPTITTSTPGTRPIAARARAISSAAPSPCTRVGRMTMCAFGCRRRSTWMMSRTAAPSSDVTMPILRGRAGSARLRRGSNRPAAWSRCFNCSNASCRAPSPSGSRCSQTSWYSPFGSYTLMRPRATTRSPSCGLKRSIRIADRNMTPRICELGSFKVKYMWPVFHTLQLESSPSTQTSMN